MSYAQFLMILATIHLARVIPMKTSFWLAYALMVLAAISLFWPAGWRFTA